MVRLEEAVAQVAGKRVLFLGRTRTMSEEDIELFLDRVGAQRAKSMEDEEIGLIVLGRLVNPVEEAWSDAQEKAGIPVVTLEALERWYATHIDAESLLASLTLFPNRERMINLLHNPAIGDDLFCDILKRYDWEGLGPYESDENRDIAGSVVARFYPDIKRNHNIQYSPVGLFLVAAQADNPALLEALTKIPDYEITQRSQDAWMPRSLHEALLSNPALPEPLLLSFLQKDETRLRGLLAAHPSLPEAMQERLVREEDVWVLEGLARNPSLSDAVRETLMQTGPPKVRQSVATHQPFDAKTLQRLVDEKEEEILCALASNERLEKEAFEKLMESGIESVLVALASNEALPVELPERLERTRMPSILRALAGNPSAPKALLERLTRVRDKALYVALAQNPSTPERLLRNFSKIKEKDIQKALAANPATPIEILLAYQTDGELNQILKRNEAFGDYIRQNLGMQ
ncbi:hypothetical protein [Hydrogenimonas urashimensis]|uniref:hypothetical protein n=1 Tax=Hydrogenimonas urashimensis TaxID=2740515 RepID=UPI0019165FD0|nr:hypothetical protein [Hydrogenimonas urashimensis]